MTNFFVRRFSSNSIAQSDFKLVKKCKDLMLQGLHVEALQLYKNQQPHFHLHSFTFVLPSLIKACSFSQIHHGLGLQLHSHSLKLGLDSEPIVSNSIISFYAKVCDVESARKVFDEMPQRDFISWNSLINCFVKNGNCVEALEIFKKMYESGSVAKPELIASIVSIWAHYGCASVGKMIHALSIVDERFEKQSVFLSTALVDLYWRSEDSVTAFRVFDAMTDKNEVSWTTMIAGYVSTNDYLIALDCFRRMQRDGIKPNRVTLISVLPACIELGTVSLGKQIHGYAFRYGLSTDIRVISSLVHLYSKHTDSLPHAEILFEKSTQKDVVLWSTIIAGYSQFKQTAEKSITLLNQMRKDGIQPNFVTILSVLTACTNIPSLALGCGLHGYVVKSGLDYDMSITNSLCNLYSKCGSLKESHQVFREMSAPDCISWSALINAYGVHGCGEEALQLFSEMKEKGIKYDSVTFLSVLSACNHSGLIEEGCRLFSEAVKSESEIVNVEHYACYIDLLGKAGKIELAIDVLRTMPMKPSPKIMSSLVSAFKIHGRLDYVESLLSWFVESEPGNVANYTLLIMIYAEFGKWLNVEGIQKDMKLSGLKKNYGYSRLES
ncbi:pentatricopeptide repeat-containing protein At4g31070, mitochondrial-like [Rutidosis leptorrhynchoides]|uniref:pentatricopeptide repeat-containing protein At4g31070, mitochondrial-like n=1 Tax=Rutidosis leptorrhynchoides TaxID=125765 RepID=UPI003A993A72